MNKILPLIIIPLVSFGQNLIVQNPSFEGTPGAGITPAPWFTCLQGQTPDTQPGFWAVDLPPSDGNSYLGFVHQPADNWQEGATQELLNQYTGDPQPMIAGNIYEFTIDITGFEAFDPFGSYPGNAELQVYGGFVLCPQSELLWSSGDTPDASWTEYTITFTPSQDYTHIMLQTNSLDGIESTYLLIDNMSPISGCQAILIDSLQNTCNGNDGFIETSIIEDLNGDPPYSYLWSNGATTPNIYNLEPGIYNLEVTDSDGDCIAYLSQEITGLTLQGLATNNSCEGQNNGAISISVSGGATPYQYLWSNGATSENLSNIGTGDYFVTITDDNGCEISEYFSISPEPIFLIISPDECNENFDISINDLNADFNQWILIENPDGNLPYFDDANSPSTQFSVSEIGQYTIGAVVCGDTLQQNISVDEFISVINPEYQHCVLSSTVILYPGFGTVDLLEGPANATISYGPGNIAEIVVDSFGLYKFQYTACGRLYYFHIAFGCPPVIPNVLTLNEDENNDLFIINLVTPELYYESMLTIFNRWGQIVYISSNYGFSDDWWDGTQMYTNKKVNNGTYYYTLELLHRFKNEKNLFSGYLHVVGK
jgi:gliding motility-associated-like protein